MNEMEQYKERERLAMYNQLVASPGWKLLSHILQRQLDECVAQLALGDLGDLENFTINAVGLRERIRSIRNLMHLPQNAINSLETSIRARSSDDQEGEDEEFSDPDKPFPEIPETDLTKGLTDGYQS